MQKIIHGDCLEEMRKMGDNSIDFIVTDPPYGINFMSKKFDKFKNQPAFNPEYWKEVLRICKPGSMLAAFGGDRTHHHLMNALELAGWEIRTCCYWLTGQGFPKSHNHFGLEGYGTALKPAAEIIVIAMKPLDGTYKQNAEKWGIGGLNIDDSRIGTTREVPASHSKNKNGIGQIGLGIPSNDELNPNKGRWPANLILDEETAEMLDQQTGILGKSQGGQTNNALRRNQTIYGKGKDNCIKKDPGFGDSGGASRFFYVAKASSSERNHGLEGMPLKQSNPNFGSGGFSRPTDKPEREIKPAANHHPTVKPLALMRYIIKLLAPPNNPILLDPFCGSGSTLVAAKQLGIRAIGIEMEAEYCEIALRRVEAIKQEDKQFEL